MRLNFFSGKNRPPSFRLPFHFAFPFPLSFSQMGYIYCPENIGRAGKPFQAADRQPEALERLHALISVLRHQLGSAAHVLQAGLEGGCGSNSPCGRLVWK